MQARRVAVECLLQLLAADCGAGVQGAQCGGPTPQAVNRRSRIVAK
jgi:hypothetical protein